MKRQPDLFATTGNIDQALSLDATSMERMARLRLTALLEEVRQADHLPWNGQRAQVNALLFHNMANWLPIPERDSLRAAFRAELERLGDVCSGAVRATASRNSTT